MFYAMPYYPPFPPSPLGEEPPFGSPEKPAELYSTIEHFCNGRRRLELFGADHNVRRGWLTLGALSQSWLYTHAPAMLDTEADG